MPIFGIGSKFSPKKVPPRKSVLSLNSEEGLQPLVNENHGITLKLGDSTCLFENGDWVPASGNNGTVHKSNKKLQGKIQELEEENNMLRLKVEILLNMLTETTAESHLQQREIDKLKRT